MITLVSHDLNQLLFNFKWIYMQIQDLTFDLEIGLKKAHPRPTRQDHDAGGSVP